MDRRAWFATLYASDWVVYAKRPFGGPEQVLQYLGRYTRRVALSNERLVSFDKRAVCFRYKDYAHGGRRRVMALAPCEFLRRFVLRVLPRGFVRIRHYGLAANRGKRERLARARAAAVNRLPETRARPTAGHPTARPRLPRSARLTLRRPSVILPAAPTTPSETTCAAHARSGCALRAPVSRRSRPRTLFNSHTASP